MGCNLFTAQASSTTLIRWYPIAIGWIWIWMLKFRERSVLVLLEIVTREILHRVDFAEVWVLIIALAVDGEKIYCWFIKDALNRP